MQKPNFRYPENYPEKKIQKKNSQIADIPSRECREMREPPPIKPELCLYTIRCSAATTNYPGASGIVKINIDVALDSVNFLAGFGVVVRDHLGSVLGSSWQKVDASFSPQFAEAIAILRGIGLASDLCVRIGMIESDTAVVVNHINGNMMSNSEIDICKEAKKVWELSDFREVLCPFKGLDVLDILCSLSSLFSRDQLAKFIVILWCLWGNRNAAINGGRVREASALYYMPK
ncbi:hypothetical protein ACOSQ4_012085 [Xanthoceras sorbifolium]